MRLLSALIFSLSVGLQSIQCGSLPAITADVVVYGATPAGVCAAVAAAREGATVTLVEPLLQVGGVMSSGLSFSDSNQTVRNTLHGLFEEVHQRIAKVYAERGVKLPYDVSVKDNAHWTYEPHVAERVFNDMLREAGVKVLPNETLTSATKNAGRLEKLLTDKHEHTARVFIDASYEGDLLAASGVSFTLGRESKEKYGELFAGLQFSKKEIKANAHDASGHLLPLITTEAAAPDGSDAKPMGYCFRLTMTNDPANRIPIEKPAAYDPARFEIARQAWRTGKPFDVGLDLYPIPGNKVDANNGIGRQVSSNLPGPQWNWCQSSAVERQHLWQMHKDYMLEFIWFLQNDPSVPEATKQTFSEYGLCKDEFPNNGHWPPALYVREGRRMIGELVLTQSDILTNITKPDSIAVGSFPIDSHDCQRVATPDGWRNEGTIFPVHMKGTKHGQFHQLPYRALLPKAAECSNLLVPVGLSASHVAYCSVRVEPTWMVLGQASGVAAAMAAKHDSTVQAVPVKQLQDHLKAQGQVIDLPADDSVTK